MKPIILFIFEAFYPCGGTADIAGFFASEHEAFLALTKHEGGEQLAEILDCQDGHATRYHRAVGEWHNTKSGIIPQFDAHRTQSGN